MSRPKPPARRQHREKPQPGDDRNVVSLVPQPPTGLLKASRDWWGDFFSSELARHTFALSDVPAVTRLARLYDERERMRRTIGSNRVVQGSQGQPRPHPAFQTIASMDAEIRQLEDRFGLTPKARMTLGIALGQAKRTL